MSRHDTCSRYELEVVRERDGVGFGRRRVPAAYLEPAREQTIFLAQRRGAVAADPTGVSVLDTPIFADATMGEVQGIEMCLDGSGPSSELGDPLAVRFTTRIFQSFGQRLATELVEAKQVDGSDEIRLRVYAKAGANRIESKPVDSHPVAGGTGVVRAPLPLLEGRFDTLLPHATAVGPPVDRDYPVFITAAALDEAHELVWERNRERGVWLVGNLYRQHRPAEIFAVVHTVFEARGTTHERFSINFSTETFTHVERQLELRRARLGRPADALVGFYHTHPFLPSVLDGMEACPTCSLRPTCTLTSSFFSQRDQAFHAAMFGSAAYAVQIVLGLTPREEFDVKMYCYDGGRFRERGYYRLAEMPHAMPAGVQ